MIDPADQDYNAAVAKSDTQDEYQIQPGAHKNEDNTPTKILELKDYNFSPPQASSPEDGSNNTEDDSTKKGKFQSAREGLRRINSIVKSKMDVLGRVPKFGGKKKADTSSQPQNDLTSDKQYSLEDLRTILDTPEPTPVSSPVAENREFSENEHQDRHAYLTKPRSRTAIVGDNISDLDRFSFHNVGEIIHKSSGEHSEQLENLARRQSETNSEGGSHFDEPYCGSTDGSLSDNGEASNFWGSEFDESSYQEEVLAESGEAPDKPLPPKPVKKAFFSRAKSTTSVAALSDDLSLSCLPVTIDSEKHPPPQLPPQPPGLTQNQIKRRLVVASIIASESSYLECLERLILEYEMPVLEQMPQSKPHTRLVFAEMRNIISHHRMFQIELSECARVWDQEEKIGDIFTASFSKTMMINAYSGYVNNFAAAMDEIRSLQRSRQSFEDFLLKKQYSPDRLSIFGLMVKPVQRFPQFIMILQDLTRFTPQEHVDRKALQLALTELENVAYRLNEHKRQSEQKFQVQQTIQHLIRQKVQHVLNTWNLDLDLKRRLIRSDNLEELCGQPDSVKSKDRRVFLMNDLLLCVKVLQKDQAGYPIERFALRWMAKLKDLELKDAASLSEMQSIMKRESGTVHIAQQEEKDPFHLLIELQEMMHDHDIWGQIMALLAKLKRSYLGHGLKEELVGEIQKDLLDMIHIKEEQMRLASNHSIILQDNSRSDKPQYVLETQTVSLKQDWCLDFLMAKLALDRSNNIAWDGTSGSDGTDFDLTPACFMKHIVVDVPKKYTKIMCAVPVYLTPKKSASGHAAVQHLWVCSSTPSYGQVSVLTVHSSKPALVESFRACNCDITTTELVPGCGHMTWEADAVFSFDTVWMATVQNQILVYSLTSQDGVRREPLQNISTSFLITSMKFVDERLFCGSPTGVLAVYSRGQDGSWNISDPTTLSFGSSSVKLHFVHGDNIWHSCESRLYQVDTDSLRTEAMSVLNAGQDIDQAVKSGVGVWVSFREISVIRLFHLETMENLQEISVRNFVTRILAEKQWATNGSIEGMAVTSLAASRGLLWIGTSMGLVLTLPLPRLSDGIPMYRGSPKLSLHAHKGPVKFLMLLQCSSNIIEMNKGSSLQSVLQARQSQRNLERQEMENSWKRKETKIATERVKNVNTDDQDLISGLQDDIHTSLMSSLKVDVSQTSGSQDLISFHDSDDNISQLGKSMMSEKNEILTDLGSLRMRNKRVSSEVDRKSKTLALHSGISLRAARDRAKLISQSNSDLTSTEVREVEMLYTALLEDNLAGKEHGGVETTNNSAAANGNLARWSRLNPMSVPLSSAIVKPFFEHESDIQTSGGVESSICANVNPASGPSPICDNANHVLPVIDGSTNPTLTLMKNKTTKPAPGPTTSNSAVVIVSGGDGYFDLDHSRRESKTDDACVLLWIHKFH